MLTTTANARRCDSMAPPCMAVFSHPASMTPVPGFQVESDGTIEPLTSFAPAAGVYVQPDQGQNGDHRIGNKDFQPGVVSCPDCQNKRADDSKQQQKPGSQNGCDGGQRPDECMIGRGLLNWRRNLLLRVLRFIWPR